MSNFGQKAITFVKNNDTNIITGIGIADGLVLGGYLWYKTGKKVNNIIKNKEEEYARELTFKEKVTNTWKIFALPAINTLVSGGLLIYSTKVGNKRLAALGAAYNLTETAFKEYIEKTKETQGEEKAEEIKKKVVEDHMNSEKEAANTNTTGDILVHEPATGINFWTTWDKVDLAILKCQQKAILGNGIVHLSYFFEELGLEATDATDLLGWDVNKTGDICISKIAILDKEGNPCGSLDYHGDLRSLD